MSDTNVHVQEQIDAVKGNAKKWKDLSDSKKLEYLYDARRILDTIVDEWGAACNKSRGYSAPHLEGNGYGIGPGMTGLHLNGLIRTYESLAKTGKAPVGKSTRKVGDQTVVTVYPLSFVEQLFMPINVELWLEPGKDATQGKCREKSGVCGILSPGNYEAPMDILTKMFVESNVCIYARHQNIAKSNCFIAKLFKKLIKHGYLSIVEPGIPNADYLARSTDLTEILMTGGCATFDKIVWGNDTSKTTRRIQTPIEAELGAVSPYIIFPSDDWSEKQISHHARALAGWKCLNSSAVCASPQLLITSKNWKHKKAFMHSLTTALTKSEGYPIFYGGTQDRVDQAANAYPADKVQKITPDKGELKPIIVKSLTESDLGSWSTQNEAFAPVLVDLEIDADGVKDFMKKTQEIVNSDKVFGSLSCSVMIHPTAAGKVGTNELDNWLKSMEWGTTSINTWGGNGTLFPTGLWGAYPKHTPQDVQSGIGILSNALMYDHPQKQVLRSPFIADNHPRSAAPSMADSLLLKKMSYYVANPGFCRFASLIAAAVRAKL